MVNVQALAESFISGPVSIRRDSIERLRDEYRRTMFNEIASNRPHVIWLKRLQAAELALKTLDEGGHA